MEPEKKNIPGSLILVVDDEVDIQELIRYNLEREGFRAVCVATGEEALESAASLGPDLIILDLMLPGIGGLDVCRILKNDSKTAAVPILMLTARSEEPDMVVGLELGADDYITKPFSPRVLVARVKAVLRRISAAEESPEDVIRVHDLVIDPGRREVLLAGEPLDLTFTEFQILRFLAGRPGWVFSRAQIIDAVRGTYYAVTDRAVDVQIAGLRKKLGPAGGAIETVRGVGYRYRER